MNTTQNIQLHQRIEIAFWALLISIMKETLRLRLRVPDLSRPMKVLGLILFTVQSLVLALSGLVLGIILGYVFRLVG